MSPVLRGFLIVVALFPPSFPAFAAESDASAIFLVAKRDLADPNFRETVVLVTHPPRGAPFGVIINRPLGERLSDVFPDQPSLKGRKDVLYFGGPVARQGLVFLVRSAKPPQGVIMVLRDVFFTSDVELIEKLFQRKDPLAGLRIFAGYSGWAPGQLQAEIARGGWHVVPADAESVFDKDPARLWPELIERATARQAWRDEGGGSEAGVSKDVPAHVLARERPARYYATGWDEEAPESAPPGTRHSSLVTRHDLRAGGARP